MEISGTYIKSFPNKVINVHPALLPKYGGKGMYGMHVQTAVVENNELESGITIHYVNENYDEGAVIFQSKCTRFTAQTIQCSGYENSSPREWKYFSRNYTTVLLESGKAKAKILHCLERTSQPDF